MQKTTVAGIQSYVLVEPLPVHTLLHSLSSLRALEYFHPARCVGELTHAPVAWKSAKILAFSKAWHTHTHTFRQKCMPSDAAPAFSSFSNNPAARHDARQLPTPCLNFKTNTTGAKTYGYGRRKGRGKDMPFANPCSVLLRKPVM